MKMTNLVEDEEISEVCNIQENCGNRKFKKMLNWFELIIFCASN